MYFELKIVDLNSTSLAIINQKLVQNNSAYTRVYTVDIFFEYESNLTKYKTKILRIKIATKF